MPSGLETPLIYYVNALMYTTEIQTKGMEMILRLILGFLVFCAYEVSGEPKFDPPINQESRFIGKKYENGMVARECVSAYPRILGEDGRPSLEQSRWEIAVQKRCKSKFALVTTNGSAKKEYSDACRDVEEKFEKMATRWKKFGGPKVVDRIPRCVCEVAWSTQKVLDPYVCTIYYSTNKYPNASLKLDDTNILLDY